MQRKTPCEEDFFKLINKDEQIHFGAMNAFDVDAYAKYDYNFHYHNYYITLVIQPSRSTKPEKKQRIQSIKLTIYGEIFKHEMIFLQKVKRIGNKTHAPFSKRCKVSPKVSTNFNTSFAMITADIKRLQVYSEICF